MKLIWVASLMCLTLLAGCASGGRGVERSHAGGSEQCQAITPDGIAELFLRWNTALETREAEKVVALYAEHSILLPTLWNGPKISKAQKLRYFEHFLHDWPSGKVVDRFVDIGCNTVVDAGIYVFKFERTRTEARARYSYTWRWNGTDWRITSHHSSQMPRKHEHRHDHKHEHERGNDRGR